jgi:hypothetical protein
MAGEDRYFWNKAHSTMNNHAVNIVRALKASKITSRLNLRIRLSYACAQLISPSLTGIRLGAPIHPWAFTYCFYQTENPDAAAKIFLGKTNLPPIMRTLKNAGDLGFGWNAHLYCKPIKILSDIGSIMPALFPFLSLLFCLVVARADELPVIKDSEAVQYVGKNVEVRGLVVSVTSSPLGTAFINFGREYPDQTFAGFIAAGSKMTTDLRIDTLQGKIIGITGIIELYQGKPEIEVTSTDQIKLMRWLGTRNRS